MLLQEYFLHTRSTYGVASFPKGHAYYSDLLAWHLSVALKPETVYQIGLEEVQRIRNNMIRVRALSIHILLTSIIWYKMVVYFI